MRTWKVLAGFGAAWAGLLLGTRASAQTFGGTADVVEVEVPVQVVRDGQPVRGLTRDDFEVYDGRTRQTLTGFHAVDLAAPAAQRAATVPPAGRRQFLLLFDLAFSDPKSVVKAREAARELVIKGLRPGDLVGVATYSAARGSQLVLGLTSDRRQESPITGQLPQAGVGTSDPHLESSDDAAGSTHAVNAVEKMLEEFRRADCVIQAVDLGGLRAGGEQGVTRTAGKDSLFTLARGTGGELFEGSNDLSPAMNGLLQRTSVTYVLSFQPDKVKPDGAYHKLRVELKNAPRGTRLAFRPGWYAPRPYHQLNPTEKPS